MPDISLAEILNDPEFKESPKEDQEKIIQKWNSKASPISLPDRKPVPTGKFLVKTESKGLEPSPLEAYKPLLGGAVGAASGAIGGGLPGAAMGGALGAMNPPESPGDISSNLIMGAISSKLPGIMNLVKSPAAKTALAGILGLVQQQGGIATREGTNRVANTLGGSNKEGAFTSDFSNLTKMPLSEQAGMAISTLLPMLGQHTANKVAGRPISAATGFAKEQGTTGVTGPSNLSDVESQALRPTFQKTFDAARSKPAILQDILDKQKAANSEMGNLNVQKAELEAQKRLSTAVATEARQLDPVTEQLQLSNQQMGKPDTLVAQAELAKANRYGKPVNVRQAKADAVLAEKLETERRNLGILEQKQLQEIQAGNFKTEAAKTNAVKGDVDVKKAKLSNVIDDLKLKSENWDAQHPELRQLAFESPGPEEFINNVFDKATPAGVSALYSHLASKAGGQQHIKEFQAQMVDRFMAKAYTGDSNNPLGNAPKLFAQDGPFSPDKLRALYGKGAEGDTKVAEFRRAIDSLSNLAQKEKTQTGLTNTIGRAGVYSGIYLLPKMLMFHSSPGQIATETIAAGAAATYLMGVKYPQLIDKILTDKKFGDSFYKYSQSADRQAQSLYEWPTIGNWLKKNGEKVEVPEAREPFYPSQATANPPTTP